MYHVHALSNKQILQRLQRGPHFLGFLGSTKLRYILTVEEAWVYLDTTNGVRRVYYEIKRARTPESWTKFCKKFHPVGMMFFAGICWRSVTTLRFIEPGAKINSDYYIKHCLKPLIEIDIPHLYPGEKHKIVLQNSAPVHASKNTFWNPGYNLFRPSSGWAIPRSGSDGLRGQQKIQVGFV
ncbi:hypothetical protein BV898_07984 [Hypsibius exemplaris]|uniref:Tc1-like transposase DDE domain-containing protein n=1 Tax=Hypsibius exemplaris TaxID=2072580 RepID=A0A1W0WSC0_HYPEX|nr:hypothetical protein BV898_07984 [Hypsibius exemplaris]